MASEGVLLRECKGHSGAVNAVRFTKDGNYVMSCSDDRTVRLWNPHKADPSKSEGEALLIKKYDGVHGYQILDCAISHDNSKFATCGGDKVCFLLDVSSGKVLRRFQGHTQRVNAVQLNDESTVLFTGSYDKAAHIWDLRSHMRDPIQSLTDFTDSVTSIALSRSEIMTSCVDGKVRTYDIRMGRMLVDDFHDPVIFTRFSYDQRCALSTCLNGVLRLTEVGTGKLLQSYSGHLNNSYKVEAHITNDDARVIGGSEDGLVYLWDLVTASVITSYKTHNGAISSICFHPSHALFLTSSYNGSIKVWKDKKES